MNQQKHKRKESYSLLLVSNTGKDTRQFYLSLKTLRMIIVLMLLVCATFAWNIFRSGTHYRIESDLRQKLTSSEQQVRQLESEKETLNARNAALMEENELYRQAEIVKAEVAEMSEVEESTEEAPQKDTSVPSQYPCTAGGLLKESYSEEHPYISISAQQEDRITVAGCLSRGRLYISDHYRSGSWEWLQIALYVPAGGRCAGGDGAAGAEPRHTDRHQWK